MQTVQTKIWLHLFISSLNNSMKKQKLGEKKMKNFS